MIVDETYTFGRDTYSRENVSRAHQHRLREDERRGQGEGAEPAPDGDYALSWIRREGKGRVFYEAHGHNEKIYAIAGGGHPRRPSPRLSGPAGRRLEDRGYQPRRSDAHRRRRPSRRTAAERPRRPSPDGPAPERRRSTATRCESPKPSSHSVSRVAAGRERVYGVQEVLDAVDSVHPAIEIPDSRYDDFARVGAPQLIADVACACWLIVGATAMHDWRRLDLSAHSVATFLNDRPAETDLGANVLRDPRLALTWLANELRTYGHGLRAGDLVTTGTCITPVRSRREIQFRVGFRRSRITGVQHGS